MMTSDPVWIPNPRTSITSSLHTIVYFPAGTTNLAGVVRELNATIISPQLSRPEGIQDASAPVPHLPYGKPDETYEDQSDAYNT